MTLKMATVLAATIAVAGGLRSAQADDEKAPPARVPPRLDTWEVAVSQMAFPHAVWPIGVRSDGTFIETDVFQRNARPRMQPLKIPGVSKRTLEPVFDAARTVLNRFDLPTPREAAITHDAGLHQVRLSSGGRSMRVDLDPGQVTALELGGPTRVLCDTFNPGGLGQPGVGFGIPSDWKRDWTAVGPGPERKDIVPPAGVSLEHLELGIASGDRDLSFRVARGRLELVVFDPDGRPTESSDLGAIVGQSFSFFECARTIVNRFELRDRKREPPARDVVRCSLELRTRLRGIRVEFECDEETPVEWRTSLTGALDTIRQTAGPSVEIPKLPWAR